MFSIETWKSSIYYLSIDNYEFLWKFKISGHFVRFLQWNTSNIEYWHTYKKWMTNNDCFSVFIMYRPADSFIIGSLFGSLLMCRSLNVEFFESYIIFVVIFSNWEREKKSFFDHKNFYLIFEQVKENAM